MSEKGKEETRKKTKTGRGWLKGESGETTSVSQGLHACRRHYDFSGLRLDPPLHGGIESKYPPHLPMAMTSHTRVECGYDIGMYYRGT